MSGRSASGRTGTTHVLTTACFTTSYIPVTGTGFNRWFMPSSLTDTRVTGFNKFMPSSLTDTRVNGTENARHVSILPPSLILVGGTP